MQSRTGRIARTILVAGLALAATAAAAAEHGYLGTSLARFESADGAGKEGIYVVGLSEGSAAAAAGVKLNDRIVAIDSVKIGELVDVDRALDGAAPGNAVNVTVQRDRQERTYEVVLTPQPQKGILKVVGNAAIHLIPEGQTALGVQTQTLGRQLADFFGVDAGVLVTDVRENGPAWHADLRAGDVIVAFDGAPIAGRGELDAALGSRKPGDVVDLDIRRRGEPVRLPVTLGAPEKESYSVTIDVDPAGSSSFDVELQPVKEKSPGPAPDERR